MHDEEKAERAEKSCIIDRIRLITFEHDLEAVERDSRSEKMYDMTVPELKTLQKRLRNTPNERKVSVLVQEITKSRHRREGIA